MLISFKIYIEYLEIGVDCIVRNCGFSKLTSSTTNWTSWNTFIVKTIGLLTHVVGTTCSISSSTWMFLNYLFNVDLMFVFSIDLSCF